MDMKSREEVVEMVRTKIRLKHYSLKTEEAYCGWVARFYDFTEDIGRDVPSEKKVERFLTHLAINNRIGPRTQNQALAGLIFLYTNVLNKPLGDIDALRAKIPNHIRTAPSVADIRDFRNAVRDTPQTPTRLIVDLLYGCGMRVSEPLELRIKDVQLDKGQITIREAKGGKDRKVPIPKICIEPLRSQIKKVKLMWEADRLADPEIGVSLPNRREKAQQGSHAWQWF